MIMLHYLRNRNAYEEPIMASWQSYLGNKSFPLRSSTSNEYILVILSNDGIDGIKVMLKARSIQLVYNIVFADSYRLTRLTRLWSRHDL